MTGPARIVLACLVLALAGCDDVLLFDVAPDGRLLAPVDARGRVVAVGDGTTPRHLAHLDPATGRVELLTRTPYALSWPRACGDGAVFVEGRHRLVHLDRDGTPRVLFESDLQLFQPTPSPTGARVAVLEAEKPGRPGLLHVIDVKTRATGVPLDGALLGFTWSREGLVVARLTACGGDAASFEGGQGEVLLCGDERRVLHEGRLKGVTQLAAGSRGAVCALPVLDAQGGLNLSRLDLSGGRAVAGERARAIDLWPTIDGADRVLFTRSWPGDRATLEGELRLSSLGGLAESSLVETPGPVAAPRWVRGDLVAYLTPDDRLVTQALDGSGLVDWTGRLRAAGGAE